MRHKVIIMVGRCIFIMFGLTYDFIVDNYRVAVEMDELLSLWNC